MGLIMKGILWVIIIVVFDTVSCKNSGTYMYVSIAALNEVAEANVNYRIMDSVNNKHIADVHGNSLGGSMEWSFMDIVVTALAKPDLSVWLDDSNVISMEAKGFTVSITGNYRFKIWGASTSGTFHGTLCGNVMERVTLGSDDVVSFLECDANADCGMAIFLDNKHFSMPTIIQDSINSYAKDILSSKMKDLVCRTFRKSDFSNEYTIYQLNKQFGFNGRIKEVLNLGKNGVILGMSGVVFARNTNTTTSAWGENNPYTPPDIKPLNISTSKMMEIVLTNYTVSTFVYSAVKQGCLDKVIHSRTLPPDQQIYFAIDCLDVCFGKFFPILKRKFPGGLVDVDITFDSETVSRITEQSVTIYNTIILDFHFGNFSIVKFSIKTATSAMPFIAKDTVVISGKFLDLNIENINMISSSVGHVPMSSLKWLSGIIQKVYLIPRIKDILHSDINMDYTLLSPKSGRISNLMMYSNADIKLNKDTIEISANIAIRPDRYIRSIQTDPTPPPKSFQRLFAKQLRKPQGSVTLI